jgi:hypothetical protein
MVNAIGDAANPSPVGAGFTPAHDPAANNIVQAGFTPAHHPAVNNIVRAGFTPAHHPAANDMVRAGLAPAHDPMANDIVRAGFTPALNRQWKGRSQGAPLHQKPATFPLPHGKRGSLIVAILNGAWRALHAIYLATEVEDMTLFHHEDIKTTKNHKEILCDLSGPLRSLRDDSERSNRIKQKTEVTEFISVNSVNLRFRCAPI